MTNAIIGQVYGLKCCSPDIQHVSWDVWWQTLSSDCCMTWSVAVLIYNTSAVMADNKRYHQTVAWLEVLIYNPSVVMCDGKRYHQTVVWLEVLQSWYTTHQLLLSITNAIIWLLYDLKCCSHYIQHVSGDALMINSIIRLLYDLKVLQLLYTTRQRWCFDDKLYH